MRNLVFIVLIGIIPSLWACGGKGKEDKVLATVNGQTITEGMLEEEARLLPPYIRPMLETPEGRLQFLESLITRDLLMQEALRRGVDRRDEVRARLSQARRSIVLEALLREVTEKAPGLSEEALRKAYESNTENFRVGERVRVSHLLFKEPEMAEEYARRAKKGAPFEGLMKSASGEGGVTADLGFIERGKFDKDFEAAAFSAPAGSVVGPVKTPYGFHVIKVGEKRPAGVQPFEEVKGQLSADLREQAQREAFETLLTQMKKQSKIRLMVSQAGGKEIPAAGTPSPQGGR